jgi:hypothetical protein
VAEGWTVEGRCPHGYSARLPFDDLGYLMKPPDSSCDQHRRVVKTVHGVEVPPSAGPAPSRWKMWRATRKARRQLRDW